MLSKLLIEVDRCSQRWKFSLQLRMFASEFVMRLYGCSAIYAFALEVWSHSRAFTEYLSILFLVLFLSLFLDIFLIY
jgi:hypothetical protein